MMTSLRLLHSLQVLCVLAAWNWNSDNAGAGAFQPASYGAFSSGSNTKTTNKNTNTQRLPSSLLSSSSIQPPARDASASASTVKVVNAAALIHGPAHAAALENNNAAISPKRPKRPTTTRPATKTTTKTTRITQKGPVAIVESMEELLALMEGRDISGQAASDKNRLTLVLFHAHYCKICQRATMQMGKAAKEYPSVNFARVEAKVFPEPAADNLRTLGVAKFPFIQIYRRGACVASFSTGPTHMFMRKIRGTLDLSLERDEDCWEAFATDFATEIEANKDARRKLRPELLP